MSLAAITTKVSAPGLWNNDYFRKLLPESWATMQKRINIQFPEPYYFDIPPLAVRNTLLSACDRQALLEKGIAQEFLDHPRKYGNAKCSMCADTPGAIFVHTTASYNSSIATSISLLIPGRTVEFAWSSESGEGGYGVWKDGEMIQYHSYEEEETKCN